MSKYTNEFKLKVIKYYKEGHGFVSTARYFNIPAMATVQKWVRKYDANGYQGLIKNIKTSYSGEFKQSVVEYMHANHLSGAEAAEYFNLGNRVVYKWERIYYEEGPDALYEERRGRPRMSSKPKKKEINEKDKEDLIAEVQRLRAENAYLKKLRALVQERIQQEQKKK